MTSAMDRFSRKFFVDAKGCWSWIAGLDKDGYPVFFDGSKTVRAHRYSYELFVGEITDETLDHKCMNRSCVNPSHLVQRSRSSNALSGRYGTAFDPQQMFCSKGHPFDSSNTYYYGTQRVCKECHRIRNRSCAKRRYRNMKELEL